VLVADRTPAQHGLPQLSLSRGVGSVNNQKLSARTISSSVAAVNIIPKGRETWVMGVSEAQTSFMDKL
jgi:hypothetical protein